MVRINKLSAKLMPAAATLVICGSCGDKCDSQTWFRNYECHNADVEFNGHKLIIVYKIQFEYGPYCQNKTGKNPDVSSLPVSFEGSTCQISIDGGDYFSGQGKANAARDDCYVSTSQLFSAGIDDVEVTFDSTNSVANAVVRKSATDSGQVAQLQCVLTKDSS